MTAEKQQKNSRIFVVLMQVTAETAEKNLPLYEMERKGLKIK